MQNNPNSDPALEPLRQAINTAFSDVGMPATELLSPYDKYEQAIIDKFGRRHWRDVDPYRLAISNLALYLLAPEWFHFYLPAYLLSALQAAENPDALNHFWDRVYGLLGVLRPADKPKFNGQFERRMELLSSEQRAAVTLFVRYAINHFPDRLISVEGPSIHTLLAAYWFTERD